MEKLDVYLVTYISGFLTLQEVVSLEATCHYFRKMLSRKNDKFWKHFFIGPVKEYKRKPCYKQLIKQRKRGELLQRIKLAQKLNRRRLPLWDLVEDYPLEQIVDTYNLSHLLLRLFSFQKRNLLR